MEIKLFHGSYMAVDHPAIVNQDKVLDFNKGFYTTDHYKCAYDRAMQSWKRYGVYREPACFVSEYTLDDSALIAKVFQKPDEEWMDFILDARGSGFSTDYDIIVGPIADDRVKRILVDFLKFKEKYLFNGGSVYDARFRTEKMEVLQQIRPRKGMDFTQVTIVSDSAFAHLRYDGCRAFSREGRLLKEYSAEEEPSRNELLRILEGGVPGREMEAVRETVMKELSKPVNKNERWYGR